MARVTASEIIPLNLSKSSLMTAPALAFSISPNFYKTRHSLKKTLTKLTSMNVISNSETRISPNSFGFVSFQFQVERESSLHKICGKTGSNELWTWNSVQLQETLDYMRPAAKSGRYGIRTVHLSCRVLWDVWLSQRLHSIPLRLLEAIRRLIPVEGLESTLYEALIPKSLQ